MIAKLSGVKRIYITSEYMKLGALLKRANIAATGGEAKYLIQSGEVFVNGEPCLMRGKKLKTGDVVRYLSSVFVIAQKKL